MASEPMSRAINFVVIVFQQTLGQVVTNKTVYAEDQHAGAAQLPPPGAGDQRRREPAPELRQLRALHINAVCRSDRSRSPAPARRS